MRAIYIAFGTGNYAAQLKVVSSFESMIKAIEPYFATMLCSVMLCKMDYIKT